MARFFERVYGRARETEAGASVVAHYGASDHGILVLAGGNLQMVSEESQPYGYNRVADNGGRELVVASGATAFVGSSTSNGRNSIYDRDHGGTLVANYTGTVLAAVNTYWDTVGSPPAGTFYGMVLVAPVSACDYTVSPPVCLGARGSGNGRAAEGTVVGRSGEDLRAEILAVRSALAENPAAEEAPALVRTLAALHRRDRGDETGEYAASWGLLRSLRARLNDEGSPGAFRPAAEAALEVEAVEALTRGEHDQARTLVALAPLAEDGSVERVLGLVEAHLEAGAGRYAEAAALVEAVASEEAAEGDPESGMSEALFDLASVFAERAGGESGARGAGSVRLAQAESAKGAGSADAREALAVYPNPTTASATVALTLERVADVTVAVYDVLGRRVAMLAEGPFEIGTHRFTLDGSDLPAGIYLVRAESGERRLTERITLLR